MFLCFILYPTDISLLLQVFSHCGDIVEIRLIKDQKGCVKVYLTFNLMSDSFRLDPEREGEFLQVYM